VRTIWDPTLNESAEASKQARVQGFHAAMEIFRRFPAAGVGPGNFLLYRNRYVDGGIYEPHNLVAEMLAETGLVGSTAFVFMVVTTLINGRRVRRAAAGQLEPTVQVLDHLVVACRDSMILLFVGGMAGGNFYRFNWLWLAAFCSLAVEFTEQICSSTNCMESEMLQTVEGTNPPSSLPFS